MKFKEGDLYRYCRENRKKLALWALISMLIVLGGVFMTYGNSPFVLERNQVKAIAPGNRDKVSLKVKGTRGKETATEDVKINFQNEKEEKEKPKEDSGLGDELKALALNLGHRENLIRGKIELPTKLKDGTRLSWERETSRSWLLGFAVFPLLIYSGYRGEKSKAKREAEKVRDDFTRNLPTFSNEIILLLESGQVFHDAFLKIADSYALNEKADAFKETVISIRENAEKSNKEIVEIMKEYSVALRNRDFIRLTAIIEDSHYKGTALVEKLRAESELLWKERKNRAFEKGKLAETKLTGPMALLLLILVTITMAPAVLQM